MEFLNSFTDVSTFKGAVVAGLVSGLVFFIAGFFTGKTSVQKKYARIKNVGNNNANYVNNDKK
ncbi:hypothetical protein [Paenibacillus sp. L3-i20]|uniref:hypothetical protein n=1 Tax=Paenibacillus sp. L3-i20 TaxID=2905833 RepID=UPI001EDFF901|nr:hypothetical protein [Paenibacillus sp. L3-i20]GKU80188.1 hypothetical protein L3i20_v245850 [Paenibacillus sp. L3-i20]